MALFRIPKDAEATTAERALVSIINREGAERREAVGRNEKNEVTVVVKYYHIKPEPCGN